MYICMCMDVFMLHERAILNDIYVCMYVCMYARMYVCMYVCTYVCIIKNVRMGAEPTHNEALVLVGDDYSRAVENERNLLSDT